MAAETGFPAYSGIFILSTPRSGSSLLRYIMDTHPLVCSPGELGLGVLCESMHTAIYYTHAQLKAYTEQERAMLTLQEVRRIVGEVMSSYAALKGKRTWCEKTPKNLRYRDLLAKVFPDARFICLYRHCMDMVYSSIEGTEYGKMEEMWHYGQAFDAWAEQTAQILAFERDHPSRAVRLKYESLVTDPARELKRVFSFLGMEWSDELVEKVFTMSHDAGPSDMKVTFTKQIYSSAIGRGALLKDFSLSNGMRQRINYLLKELNYAEIGPQWDKVGEAYLQAVSRGATKKIGSVGEVFAKYIPQQMCQHEQLLSGMAGIIKFMVRGDHGGVWQVDLTRRPGRILASDGHADCTLTVGAGDLLKVVNGELNPGQCFLQAKLKVDGNVDLAYKFGQVIFSA